MRRLRDLDDAIFGHAMAPGVILDERGDSHVDREEALGLHVGLAQPSEGYTSAGASRAPLDVLRVFGVPSAV